jgi:predicted nucleotidyltransferase
MHKTRITQRSRQKKRKSEKQKTRTKLLQQKQIQNKTQAKIMQRGACDLGVMGSVMRASKEIDSEITPGCVDRVGNVVMCCDTIRCTICNA